MSRFPGSDGLPPNNIDRNAPSDCGAEQSEDGKGDSDVWYGNTRHSLQAPLLHPQPSPGWNTELSPPYSSFGPSISDILQQHQGGANQFSNAVPNQLHQDYPFLGAQGQSSLPYDLQMLLQQQGHLQGSSAMGLTGDPLSLQHFNHDTNYLGDGQAHFATSLLTPAQRQQQAVSMYPVAPSGNTMWSRGRMGDSSAEASAFLHYGAAAMSPMGPVNPLDLPTYFHPNQPGGIRPVANAPGFQNQVALGPFEQHGPSSALGAADGMTPSSSRSQSTGSAGKPVAHKAGSQSTFSKKKGKPSRPLSAYNLFFKEERQKILNDAQAEMETTSSTTNAKQSKPQRKIGFEEMAKIVGQRWEEVKADPNQKQYYQNLADEDKRRYNAELDVWKRQQSDELTQRREQLESSVGNETLEKYFESASNPQGKPRSK